MGEVSKYLMSLYELCKDSVETITTVAWMASSFPIVMGTDDSIGLELKGTCSPTEQGQLFSDIWSFTVQADSSAGVAQQSHPQDFSI